MSRFFPKFDNFIPSDVKGKKAERGYIAHLKISALKAVAADTDGIHASVTGAAQELTTGITNPLIPRNVTATAGGTAASIKAVQVIIEGTDYAGNVITETLPAFTVDTAGTVEGSKAFKTITKITIPAHDATSATTIIGWGDKLGLPYKLPHNTVQLAFVDNVKEATAPTVTTSATVLASNTVDLNTVLNGQALDIYLIV